VTNDIADDQNPAWSPDGALIAFDSDRSGDRQVYVIRPDGTALREVTTGPGTHQGPAWRPRA
jgi:TolB protein